MKKKVKTLSLVILVLIVMGGFVSCSKQVQATEEIVAVTTQQVQAPAPKAEPAVKTIVLAMVSPWDSVIPFDTTSSYSDVILDLLFDKMVYLKADGTYYSRLAEKSEMNEDSTVLTFHLNKQAKWHDGTPVTAKDVVFTSKLYAAPSMASLRQNNLGAFAGFGESDDSIQVVALDDYTVQYTCSEPTNIDYLLFNKFRDIYILPEHLLGNVPIDQIRSHSYWQNPVGSGPCIYSSQISGERMEFTANKNYFLKTPSWDRLIVRVVSQSNLLAGLINGEIDALAGNVGSLQLADWDMAKKQNSIQTVSVPSLGYQYMAINTSKPYLSDAVRRAINMAINRNLIIEGLLQGEGVAAYGPVSPQNIYYNSAIEEPYNPEGAKNLLAQANWNPNQVLVMSVPTGNTLREQSAVIIQQNLADVGIKVKIETADFATHLNRVRKSDYDLGLIGSSGSPDPSECVINFNPNHMNNFSQLSDWTVHDTGAKGQYAFGFEDRKVHYDAYQKLLREQVPFAFLYYQNILYGHTNRIKGITDVQDYTQLNRDVWNWSIQ